VGLIQIVINKREYDNKCVRECFTRTVLMTIKATLKLLFENKNLKNKAEGFFKLKKKLKFFWYLLLFLIYLFFNRVIEFELNNNKGNVNLCP